MNGLLNTLLTHKLPETERKWYHVILWWELRRILYNLALLVIGTLGVLCMTLVVNGTEDFISGLAIIGFVFFANFFYTFGWIVELFLRLVNKHKAASFGLKSFKVGFIIAICGTFVPSFIFCIVGLIRGEKVSSPYSHFAKKQPEFGKLVGTYHFDKENSIELDSADKKLSPTITLNTDSTFVLANFPIEEMLSYGLCNGKGKWRIEKDDSWNAWTIHVKYDTLINLKTNNPKQMGADYYIYNNQPPYKIYCIAGDPDTWEAYIFK